MECVSAVRLVTLVSLLAVGVALIPTSALGFESNEHERMGNVAFAVALAYVYETPDHWEIGLPEYQEAVKLKARPGKYEGDAKYGDVSYGDIVACVDYFLYPEKILADSWKEGRRSPDAPSLPTATEKLLELKDCHPPWYSSASYFQATHSNHSHFQYDLLMSYRTYHIAAVSVARDEGNMFAALALNAIADHYLHDFFAPGHIYTPRERLTDVPATAVHDYWNDRGSNLAPKNLNQLSSIAEFICQGPVTRCALRDDLYLEDISQKSTRTEVVDALTAIFESKPIHMKGDKRLWDQDSNRLQQRLYMLLVEARSIVDVLTGENSFEQMGWEGNPTPVRANIAYGQYEIEPQSATPKMKNVVGISISRESMVGGARSGRNVLVAEYLPTVVLLSESFNLLPYVGIGKHIEGNISGIGPTLRVAFVIPQTEFAFGPYFKYFTYPSNEGDKRRFSFGVRLDSGFSSYFTIFVNVGRDTATTPEGTLRAGIIYGAGVQFSFPTSRPLR